MGRLTRRTAVRCCTLTVTAAITAPAAASAGAPDRFPVDGPAMAQAQSIARVHWGADACSGQVALAWTTELGTEVAARASWSNPLSTYDHPVANLNCAIRFNAAADFDWLKFCTVVVHEYGHLTGHRHSDDPGDVMYQTYQEPLRVCAATSDPTAPRTPDSSVGGPSAVSAPGADVPPATLRARGKIRISTFLRRSLPVACELPDARPCTVRLSYRGRTLGKGTGESPAGGANRFTVRPLTSGRRYLRQTRRGAVRATLTVIASDGRPTYRAITLRR